MVRSFSNSSVKDGAIAAIDVDLSGTRMTVVQKMRDGSTKRSAKELKTEAEARSAGEQLARELVSRGYIERASRAPSRSGTQSAERRSGEPERGQRRANPAFDDLDAPAGAAVAPLPRV